jgi:hypothetical protein
VQWQFFEAMRLWLPESGKRQFLIAICARSV